jgi:hypothetical protein
MAMGDLKALALAAAVGVAVSGTAAVADQVRHLDAVNPRAADVYKFFFEGGVTARITVIGDGGTDLDLYVVDENGNIVLMDEDNSDNCQVTLTPKWTGPFLVRVVNRGSRSNRYMLRVLD